MRDLRVNPRRVLADLEHLRTITATTAGAQRVAWTEPWEVARRWLRAQLEQLPVEVDTDQAGNLWATLAGSGNARGRGPLVIGSHLDSVPDGGWLDGCLGVLTGLEILRALADERPNGDVCLVDWADEEGARFGHSMFGSSAATGHLRLEEVRELLDADGVSLADALAACGLALERAPEADGRIQRACAYLELHIEQGPVLEEAGLALGVVDAVRGLRRHRLRFEGQSAHAGSTPMRMRRDPLAAAARFILAVREQAVRVEGVATVGDVAVRPGIPTAIPSQAELVVDQRHHEPEILDAMAVEAERSSRAICDEEGTRVSWSQIQRVDPVAFDAALVETAEACVREVTGACLRVRSGALHDAVMVARAGVPTVMLFVQSIGGLSHTRLEDSHSEHLEQAVAALGRLTTSILAPTPPV